MKQAYVNGEPISKEAVQFEFDRLVKFYATHGIGPDEIKKNLEKLMEKAQEQAIGAKLLLARAEQLDMPVDEKAIDAQLNEVIRQVGGRDNFVKALARQKIGEDDFRKTLARGCRVDALVQKACSGVPEPTEEDVAAYYEAHRASFVVPPQSDDESPVQQSLVDVADSIRDLLRHEARGRATEAFVAELREKANVEYR